MTDHDNTVPTLGDLGAGGQFYRGAGARLTEPQDQSVLDLFDKPGKKHHDGLHAFDKAHAVMLTEEEIVPESVGEQILRGLRQMEADNHVRIREDSGRSKHAGEVYLIDNFGQEIGGWLHLARSSHDLGSVSLRYALRERLLDAMAAVLDLIEAYADRATEHLEAVLPTYTGKQHAQVATIGFVLLGYERALERDFDRLVASYDRINVSPAGAAVGTTSDFPIDRERVADLLGFDGVLDNGEDVDKNYDVLLECGSVFATLLASVTRAADDFLVWDSKEFDLIELPDRYCGTSSIMPQKKNPHTITTVQRDSNDIIGEVMQQFATTKNISGSVGLSTSVLDQAISNVETWEELVRNVRFDEERGEELVYEGWALATDLAGAMVREAGVSWRTAHQITAILVRQSIEADRSIANLQTEDIDRAARAYTSEPLNLNQKTIDEVVNAERAITARSDVTGSPAPTQVRHQIDSAREFVAAGRNAVRDRRESLDSAEADLESAIDDLLVE